MRGLVTSLGHGSICKSDLTATRMMLLPCDIRAATPIYVRRVCNAYVLRLCLFKVMQACAVVALAAWHVGAACR